MTVRAPCSTVSTDGGKRDLQIQPKSVAALPFAMELVFQSVYQPKETTFAGARIG